MVPENCKVKRKNRILSINVCDLVRGDVIIVETGNKVPADSRIFFASGMMVDNASITGESEPQEKSSRTTSENAAISENLIFSGSSIVNGNGYAIVIRTGQDTVLGFIAKETLASKDDKKSLVTIELKYFTRRIVAIALIFGIFFMCAAFIDQRGVNVALEVAVGIFVAFLPQGLPATITILLTITAQRMANRNILVKELRGVETLGAMTFLATDKTGTLTQNRMAVEAGWFGGKIILDREELNRGQFSLLNNLIRVAILCSRLQANEEKEQEEKEQVTNPSSFHHLPSASITIGDPTEAGIKRFISKFVPDMHSMQKNHLKVFEIPFSSVNKWHMAIVRFPHETGHFLMTIKGAPERILNHCSSYYMEDGQISSMNNQFKIEFDKAYDCLARHGYRVLGFAERPLKMEEFSNDFQFTQDPFRNFPFDNFIFIGFLALLDPPKEQVSQAIDKCRDAGIKVSMITGDHPLTAQAIAYQVHILTNETVLIDSNFPLNSIKETSNLLSAVVHGDIIDGLDEDDWMKIFNFEEIIFTRTLPRHKLEIVKASQRMGNIVGVCGDGVNDSLALKAADLGISMNITASDISKDVATLIILDDNFASITNGIEEGRLVYENLKKSIRYTLTHIMPEILAFSLYAILKIPLPITPLLILMIDAGTEIGPATSFAYEKQEIDLMSLPCRRRSLTKEEIERDKKKRAREIEDQGKYFRKVKETFNYLFVNVNQRSKGENLIDGGLVLWTFGFGGIVLACGCYSAYLLVFVMRSVPLSSLWQTGSPIYFQSTSPPLDLLNGTVADSSIQIQILNEAQSAYYLSIVIGQYFNIFVTKHRYRCPWGRDLFTNYHTFTGMLIAATIAAIVVFIPVFQKVFHTYYVSAVALCAPVIAGIFLLLSEYIRKLFINKGKFHRNKLKGNGTRKETIKHDRVNTNGNV